MCIWVDADSCPAIVRNYIAEKAKEHSLKALFAANRNIPIEISEFVAFQLCNAGKDEADNFIFARATKGDIVVTKDILFAERLVKAEVAVMNDRGVLFTARNIEKYVSERNLSLAMANLGLKQGYSKNTYGKREFALFRECFDKTLASLL